MTASLVQQYQPLLSTASFAARAHRHQIRKDRETPYIAHPFRVCLITRHIFGIDDPRTLMAALLHDTIEDTTTDRDDIVEAFGPEVAGWVADLSKDTRLADAKRELEYMTTLAAADPAVKICKLADMFDNLMDSLNLPLPLRRKTVKRSKEYLGCLEKDLPTKAAKPMTQVRQLLAEVEATLQDATSSSKTE